MTGRRTINYRGIAKIPTNFKYFNILCILIAILNKSLIAFTYTDLEGDKALYLLFAKAFIENKQFLEPINLLDNNTTYYIYNGAILSPLYSLIAVPILKITNSFSATSIIIDVISWTCLIIGLYQLSRELSKNSTYAAIFVMCAAFFIYPHELYSMPKDTLSVALIVWSLFLIHRFLSSNHLANWYAPTISCLLILLSSSKFMYIPLAFVFLMILVVYSILRRSRKHLIVTIQIIVYTIATLLIGYEIFTQHPQVSVNLSKTSSLNEFIRGFYPENLLEFYPFLSGSIINLNFACVQLENILNQPFKYCFNGFRVLDIILIIILILNSHYWLFKKHQNIFGVLSIGFIISVVLIGILALMSVSHKSINYNESIQYAGGSSSWTYLSEARFYLFPIIFIQLFIFNFVTNPATNTFFKYTLITIFLFECLHGLYFTIKQTSHMDQIKDEVSKNTSVKKAISIARELQTANKQDSVKLITNHRHLRQYSTLHSIKAFSYSSSFKCNSELLLNNDIILLVQSNENDSLFFHCKSNLKHIYSKKIPPFILNAFKSE